jgi:hypothetical protein
MSFLTPLSIHRAHESSPNARAFVARLPDGLADDEGVQSEAAKIAFPIAGATTVVAASPRHDRRFRAWGKLDLDFGYIANAEQRVGVEIRILRLAFHELRSLVQGHAQSPQRCLQRKRTTFLPFPKLLRRGSTWRRPGARPIAPTLHTLSTCLLPLNRGGAVKNGTVFKRGRLSGWRSWTKPFQRNQYGRD